MSLSGAHVVLTELPEPPPPSEELTAMIALAREEGLLLDPVYTGKAWYGFGETLRRAPGSLGERIVFLHSGGIFGLFSKSDELLPLL